jgi:hypothetical protein
LLADRRLEYLPLFLSEVVAFLNPQYVNALERLDFIDRAPQSIEQELGARLATDDLVVENPKLAGKSKPVNLILEEGINRFLDLVLELPNAQEAQLGIAGQVRRITRSVPRLG